MLQMLRYIIQNISITHHHKKNVYVFKWVILSKIFIAKNISKSTLIWEIDCCSLVGAFSKPMLWLISSELYFLTDSYSLLQFIIHIKIRTQTHTHTSGSEWTRCVKIKPKLWEKHNLKLEFYAIHIYVHVGTYWCLLCRPHATYIWQASAWSGLCLCPFVRQSVLNYV